jgi:dihydrofolate reductase
MRKLIEVTHVSLGGEIDPLEWSIPYLDSEHEEYANGILSNADAILLGRNTYEGLSAAYSAMSPNPFVDRMNALPKYVASRTLRTVSWNATIMPGDITTYVADLKSQPGKSIVKYGNGVLDGPLMEAGLIDEFHVLLTPVAVGSGKHMFEGLAGAPQMDLLYLERLKSGVVILRYAPKQGGVNFQPAGTESV